MITTSPITIEETDDIRMSFNTIATSGAIIDIHTAVIETCHFLNIISVFIFSEDSTEIDKEFHTIDQAKVFCINYLTNKKNQIEKHHNH